MKLRLGASLVEPFRQTKAPSEGILSPRVSWIRALRLRSSRDGEHAVLDVDLYRLALDVREVALEHNPVFGRLDLNVGLEAPIVARALERRSPRDLRAVVLDEAGDVSKSVWAAHAW